ncbi:MAG: type II toxin-antitoxin system VapC family toxin [Gammaproteobacteria bacterium]|nr:type II toxin-antitoxin system VapC family toxin [Gammaproteobacteria bacterium]
MGVNGSVVVDASLAVKWLVEEDDSDKAHALLQSWEARDVTRIAPHLLPFEVAHALHRRTLRGELKAGDGARMIARLLESRLELRQPPGLHVRALRLAGQLNQSAVYDAHYLALAEMLGCELWTADERFYRAASPGIDVVRWFGAFAGSE